MYPVELKFCKDFKHNVKIITQSFSEDELISSVQDTMVQQFNIPQNSKVRSWVYLKQFSEPRQLDLNKTIKQEQLKSGQCLVLETPKSDGSWRYPLPSHLLEERTQPFRKESRSNSIRNKPGLCGLINLGNTCFMNSTLQCLSHCPPLADYFLNDNYLNDLRPNGGMDVELCQAFGDLLKLLWSGEYSDVSPSSFKMKVGKYAGQFVGFQQHDAQEFLTFLLDGLHEAINRAQKEKKLDYKQFDSDNQEKSDQELAKETWENYRRRSNSIIVDNFHGLLKSSVACPDCETVSVKFDPLCYMTLPLPQDSDCILSVLHVPYDQSLKMVTYRITVSKFGTIRDLVTKIAERVNKSPESFIIAEISNFHFHKFFSLNDSIDKINDSVHNLTAYDVPISMNDNKYTVAPVCHWEISSDAESVAGSLSYSEGSLFGVPFIVVLPTTPCTYESVYNLICERLERYIFKINDSYGENVNDESENGLNINEGLFNLYIVNGSSEAKKIPVLNDGSLLKFPEWLGNQFLVLQWTSRKRHLYYKADNNISQDHLCAQTKNKLQLQDCLSIFMSTEKLGANDTWNCPKCKVSRRATKKFDLWELPNVLIILLKRFTFNRSDNIRSFYLDNLYHRDNKLNATVEFPMTNLRLNNYLINKDHPPVSYDLFGVINHYGTLSGGHYTACAKHKDDNRWYCFDDSRVYPQAEESVMSSSAYILFYIKNNSSSTQI